jgi:hypothetical protein
MSHSPNAHTARQDSEGNAENQLILCIKDRHILIQEKTMIAIYIAAIGTILGITSWLSDVDLEGE